MKRNKNNFLTLLFLFVILTTLVIFINQRTVFQKKAQEIALAGSSLVVTQITDEHLQTSIPLRAQRLREVLVDIKGLAPDVLISTGDHIESAADSESYFAYRNLFNQVGGFSYLSDHPADDSKVPFMPIAGNHDGWTIDRFNEHRGILSYVVGNYRFIGFSDNLQTNWPQEAVEAEMQKSCVDAKPIILYHHYAPFGWWSKPQAIDAASWKKLDDLAQKYPVILYLAGHSHEDKTETIGNYLAHTGSRTELGHYSGFVLTGNRINEFGRTNKPVYLLISEPSTYFAGLDFTKTKSGLIKARAIVKPKDGTITRVNYSLDSQTPVAMTLTELNIYEASLDATELSGLHDLKITAFHSSGSWGTVSQNIPVFFSPDESLRIAPACGSLPTYPVTTPRPTVQPTTIPTIIPTAIPTAATLPPNQEITLWGFVKDRNGSPIKNAGLIINKVANSSCSGEQSGCSANLISTNQQGYWEVKCSNLQGANCLKIVEKEPIGYSDCRLNPLAQISGAGTWNYNTVVIKKLFGQAFSSNLGPITFFDCRP